MLSAFAATSLRFDHRINFSSWLHSQGYFRAVPEVRNSRQLKRPMKAREVINRFLMGSHDLCEHLWLWQIGSGLDPEARRICTVRFLGELLHRVFRDIGAVPDEIRTILDFFRDYDGRINSCLETNMRSTLEDWINICSVHEAANRSTPEEGVPLQVGMLEAAYNTPPNVVQRLKQIQNDALHAMSATTSLLNHNTQNNQYFSLRAMEDAKDAIMAMGHIYSYTVFTREQLPVVLFIRDMSQDWFEKFKRSGHAPRKLPTLNHETDQKKQISVPPPRCNPVSVTRTAAA